MSKWPHYRAKFFAALRMTCGRRIRFLAPLTSPERAVQLQGHQNKGPGDNKYRKDGERVPEVLARSRFRLAFGNCIPKDQARKQPTGVRGIVDAEEQPKNENVHHPPPELPAVGFAEAAVMETGADQDADQTEDRAGGPDRHPVGTPPQAQ